MSDGIKRMYEDLEDEIFINLVSSLAGLGYDRIAVKLQEMSKAIYQLSESNPSLTRSQWYQIDKIKTKIDELTKQ